MGFSRKILRIRENMSDGLAECRAWNWICAYCDGGNHSLMVGGRPEGEKVLLIGRILSESAKCRNVERHREEEA